MKQSVELYDQMEFNKVQLALLIKKQSSQNSETPRARRRTNLDFKDASNNESPFTPRNFPTKKLEELEWQKIIITVPDDQNLTSEESKSPSIKIELKSEASPVVNE